MEKANTVLLIAPVLFVYFLPAVIAHARRHRQTAAITLLNLFLGWTGLVWVLLFFWSLSPDVRLV
jgi:hypothetical protein